MQQAVWDPAQYLRHEGHRVRPFLDLLAHVPDTPAGRAPRVADLGCGTGNVTAIVASRWPGARITGFDNSDAMLREAAPLAGPTPGGGHLDFRHADLTTWAPEESYDLIISNAALHWIPNHRESLPRWADALAPGGVLAIQLPRQATATSHALLAAQCDAPAWRDRVGGLGPRDDGTAAPAEYLALLSGPGRTVDAWETTYAQLLAGEDPVLDWTKGSILRPVLTALGDDPAAADRFVAEYGTALRTAYRPGPHGTVYPFRRVFAVVTTPEER